MTRPAPLVSFEFFPPKTETMEQTLWQAIQRLAPLKPRFVSVTYGAGGSTRARTHATVKRILDETDLTPAAHLTCIGASRVEIDEVARGYLQMGVRHLVALRGDLPPDGPGVHEDGYRYACDLVQGLGQVGAFDISVAAYPDVHPEAPSPQADLDALKRKIDAGASRAITNFFFDPDGYLRFLDRVRKAGITVPIVPGIMPVTNFTQMVKFAATNGVPVPEKMAQRFAGLEEDAETRRLVAITTAAELVHKLQAEGVNEFHFYTLNRAELTYALCHLLGVRPAAPAASALAS